MILAPGWVGPFVRRQAAYVRWGGVNPFMPDIEPIEGGLC